MDSPRTESLKNLLKFGGLWMDFGKRRLSPVLALAQVLRYVYLVAGWIMMLNIVFKKGISSLLTPSAVFIPLGLNIVIWSIVLFSDLKNIEKLVRECDKNMSTYEQDWEKEIIAADTKLIRQMADIMNYGLCIFGVTYMLLPVLIDGVRASLGYPEPYVVPLPLDGYLSETKARDFGLYFILISSDLWFMIAIPNTVAFECMIFFFVSFATTELKILNKQLKMLYNGSDNGVLLMKEWNLSHIIRKHQQIVRLIRLQRKHITLSYMSQEVISALSICFTMFLINQVIGEDSLVTVLGCVFILMLLALIFVMCYSGEYLEEMVRYGTLPIRGLNGDKLFTEICELPWYRQTPRVRKDILTILTLSSQKLVLDYGCTFSLNLRTYMQIVNTAYSYYMLMKSSS